eukprot:CAMPEP_0197032708 /NCGR_PEP_ID=MMETSP1384-20130603/11316_1 /TAXON_ID=29189 /ORGANISM="Ammonia sp." /LENGTH=43 /DNA_ID= /DNA_START= /DNA_END= /DNA_ORIENTATION=
MAPMEQLIASDASDGGVAGRMTETETDIGMRSRCLVMAGSLNT